MPASDPHASREPEIKGASCPPSGEDPALLAHVRLDPESNTWRTHLLERHLRDTGNRAGDMARPFQSEAWAQLAGRLHDLGKYGPDFQGYLRTQSGFDPSAHLEGSGDRVDHSTAGGIWAATHLGPAGRIVAYWITGHHAGLLDGQSASGTSLEYRLAKADRLEQALLGKPPGWILTSDLPAVPASCISSSDDVHLWIRMVFSCLVDADFLDTEAFMAPGRARARSHERPSLPELKERLDRHLEALSASAPDTEVNRVRGKVLSACRNGGHQAPGLFSLTVPTGGGKTLASMAFALEHAILHGKSRVIVVIPYTSIIEQTAEAYVKAFGRDAVLEHHSNLDPGEETAEGRLAAENWDAPVIVTTNVQFFESLFAARTSACRKLHNIVDSVVVLDEAQMLPPNFLKPILAVLASLIRHYGVTGVLCTATQPALQGRIGSQKAAFDGLQGVRELMPDPALLAQKLKRVAIRLQHSELQPILWEALAEELSRHPQILCIVNTRRDCRDLHKLMPPGTLHLSALMCAEHRSDVIADLKARLKGGQSVRVISTQLVEAGVDLDFPVVYRALAGLDSMAQAAGRCNREGLLQEGRLGELVLFAPPMPAPPGLLRKGEEAGREMLRRFPEASASFDPGAFRSYFELFYGKVINFDEQGIFDLLVGGVRQGQFQFRTAADAFQLIDDSAQVSLVVRYGPCRDRVDRILAEIRHGGPNRERIRSLQRFTVTVPEAAFRALRDQGDLEEVGGLWVQAADGLYDDHLGLCANRARWNPERFIQ